MRWLQRRKWPALAAALHVTAGLLFSFFWLPLTGTGWLASKEWFVPGDLWGTFRSAEYVAWMAPGDIYGAHAGFVSFPAIVYILSPVAAVSNALHLTQAFPLALQHPTTWLILGPFEFALCSVTLFAFDSLAVHLGVSSGRRAVLCFVECVLMFPVDAVHGHPEDVLGLGLAVFALVSALDGKLVRSGWLFGAAVAVQPLVLAVFPLLAVVHGWPKMRALLRGAAPAAALLVLPYAYDRRDTFQAVVEQPNFPKLDHSTPWTSISPHLAPGEVSAGPGRVVALAAAVGIGVWAWRRRDRLGPVELTWLCALSLAMRIWTESVLDAFYLWPALALAVVATAHADRRRLWLVITGALGLCIAAEYRLPPWWLWWTIAAGGTAAVLLVAMPARRRHAPDGRCTELPAGVPSRWSGESDDEHGQDLAVSRRS